MSFVVMTDTSSNLPSSKIREHDIKEIAFPYFIKGRTYHCIDTGSFDGETFYNAIKQRGVEVTTSQITPQQYMDFYEPYLMQMGLITRTPKGRVITEKGKRHLQKS